LKPYALLDSGGQMKLELAGEVLMARPAPQALWPRTLPQRDWDKAAGVYLRSPSGGGRWDWKAKPPESWTLSHGGFAILAKPTDFGHLGFFAEQADNWKTLEALCRRRPGIKTLNLFAYSGLASLAMARGGAAVTHLDAAKGMVEWGREIHALNPDVPPTVRWLVDDVNKFLARELRRGGVHPGVVLDPPSFGRGPKGQLWKIEQGLGPLLESCRALMGDDPQFLLLSMHSQGFTPLSLERLLGQLFAGRGRIAAGEMAVAERGGRKLPSGVYALWTKEPWP
jgi:23S rRNA (cytosine1962-C5)-methyltransferase